MIQAIDKCIERLHSSVNTLTAQSVETVSIVAALAQVAGINVQQQRTLADTVPYLEDALASLTAAVHALRARTTKC